jgi:UDP-glucose 4-epimerase
MSTKPFFMGFGSFAEYGPIYQPINELDNNNPLSYYGLSKKNCKSISQMFCNKNNIEWSWIRPCYIYGPNDVPTRLIPSTINNLLNGKDLLFDECNTIIDYLYIDDFCLAILSILNTRTTGIINICSANEYKLKDIILLLQSKISSKSNISFDPKKNKNNLSKYIVGNNEKLKSIGWNTTIELDEGLEKTINSYIN